MHPEIERDRAAVSALCRRYDVARLEVFGSGARGSDFSVATGDADFLVHFREDSALPPLEQFFGLTAALSELLGRPVDLVEPQAITNPFVLSSIERSRELVYAA